MFQSNDIDKKINDFILFMIENYKNKHSLSGKETYELFLREGVIDYLTNGYELLHTLGKDYLLEDVDLFLKEWKE